MKLNETDAYLRTLLYREDGVWVAHLLEMDLVATGSTPEEAQKELKDALLAQLSFCHQQGISPYQEAPREYFDRWEASQRNILEQGAVTDSRAGLVPVTAADRKKISARSGFELAHA